MLILCFIIVAAVPYLLCGINTAIIVTKIKSGEDIRTMGSGNAGLTNTLRTQGKMAALFVLLGDVIKGVISVLLVRLAFKYIGGIDTSVISNGMNYIGFIAGVFAVLGHSFPLYYKFRGGKGVLVTAAVLLTVDWLSAIILIGIFAVIVMITKYVSLGSIIAGSLYPFLVLILGKLRGDPTVVLNFIFGLAIAFLLIFMHRENIKRLKNKTEKKLGEKTNNKLT
ncbi:MAG: glycerol-3-phosphate 1-O-acyltransferase PlsY [Eubacterium sp.]|jgi:glycerol-3-phosphate acyltransferase PlsY|nr:glycerol-3-phosphate 1-O-acyltransferase PlsY [Eubacterium sp.]